MAARRRRALLLLVATVALVVAAGREVAGLPSLQVRVGAVAAGVVGHPPDVAWPAGVHAAIGVPSAGILVTSGPQAPAPIASLTKIMTAYLVLQEHPLAPSAAGPEITMDAADVADAAADAVNDDTSVPITVGEQLSERQLLEGLLVHSANDFADALARWDAGSVPRFVAAMNAEAKLLGMTATHYADPSGISAGSVSTAADQLRLAERALTVPAFAAIDDEPVVTLPLAGTLPNYVSAVGRDGIVGVKSGFTQAAGGCLVLAADRMVGGRPVLVLAAVTGQGGYDALGQAQQEDERLVDTAGSLLRRVTVLPARTTVATVVAPWTSQPVPVETTTAATAVVWPGQRLPVVVAVRLPRVDRAGAAAGEVAVGTAAAHRLVPLVLARSLPGAGWWWRLWR